MSSMHGDEQLEQIRQDERDRQDVRKGEILREHAVHFGSGPTLGGPQPDVPWVDGPSLARSLGAAGRAAGESARKALSAIRVPGPGIMPLPPSPAYCDDGHAHLAHEYSNVGDPAGMPKHYCPGKGLRAEDDGPAYDDDPNYVGDEPSVMWLRIGLPADRIPPHTQRLLQGPVVEALKRFITKNVEYGETADALGSRGQYADINRKVGKLKRLMWDKNVPEWSISEPTEEVLQDLIGHCILSLYYIEMEKKQNGEGV